MLFVLIGLLLIVPQIYKEEITQLVKVEINNNVTAKVDFAEANLSIFRSFPDLMLSVEKLSVITKDNLTLATIDKLNLELDLISVLKGGEIILKKIIIEKPIINAVYFRDGSASWDIFPSAEAPVTVETESNESSLKLILDEIVLSNSTINYIDEELGMEIGFDGADFLLSGDMSGDVSDLQIIMKSNKFSFLYDEFAYLNHVKLEFKGGIRSDLEKFEFNFLDNKLMLNEFPVKFDGSFAMPGDDMLVNISFDSPVTDFKNLLSLLPAIYLNDFKDLSAEGVIGFNGKVNGIYNDQIIPDFNINLIVDKGNIKYPALPGSISDININMNISGYGGNTDNTVIDIKNISATMLESHLTSSLYIAKPISDPELKVNVNCNVNFDGLMDVIPMEGTKIGGSLMADIKLNGRMSDIESEKFDRFDASGNMELKNLKYSAQDFPETNISSMLLSFSPDKAVLTDLSGKSGSGDFSFKGYIQNYIPYLVNGDVIHGSLSLNSNFFDVDEFMPKGGETVEATVDSSDTGIIEIPANIDFAFDCNMKSVKYDNLEFNNCQGKLIVSEGNILFDKLYTETLKGKVDISGKFESAIPEMSLNLNLYDIDIPECYNNFNSIQKLAPIASYCNGRISSGLNIRFKLDSDMEPVLNSISGKGKFSSDRIGIVNLSTFNKIYEKIKMESFKDPVLNDVNVSFEIQDGNIEVSPFEIKFGENKAVVSGSQNVDQTLNYVISSSLPASKVSGLLTSAANEDVSKYLGNNIDLDILITGPINNPEISFKAGKSLTGIKEAAKEKVKDIINDKVDDGKQKLKAEAEKKSDEIMKEAEKQAENVRKTAKLASDKIISEADTQANALVKAAEKKSIVEKRIAEKAAQKLRDEAKQKADKLVKEADVKSEKIMNDAKEKRTKILEGV